MSNEGRNQYPGNRIPAATRHGAKPLLIEESSSRRTRDRRNFGVSTLIYGNLYCRRRHARRSSDMYTFYVDWYEPRLLYITLAVLILSCVDAVITLKVLQHGSVELNPLMALLIEKNVSLFVYAKLMLTGTGLIVLVMHVNFRIFRYVKIRHCLVGSLVAYLALVAYELVLLSEIFLPQGGIVVWLQNIM